MGRIFCGWHHSRPSSLLEWFTTYTLESGPPGGIKNTDVTRSLAFTSMYTPTPTLNQNFWGEAQDGMCMTWYIMG